MFLFQMVFMDTAATIPTGAMAERWKFSAFFLYGFFMSMIIYPVFGCWVWGGGWLADLGANFGLGNGHIDFAGSSVVHMTGGVTALAGAMDARPADRQVQQGRLAQRHPRAQHADVVMGTLILAFGWFGFNPGSTLAATDNRFVADRRAHDAGLGGRLPRARCCYMWAVFGKPDPTMGCNGLLAGPGGDHRPVRVRQPGRRGDHRRRSPACWSSGACCSSRGSSRSTTPSARSPSTASTARGAASRIGLFADGAYGAGWNGVAAAPLGLFYGGGIGQLLAEMIGVGTNFLFVFPSALAFFLIIDKTVGNRTTAKAEIEGLDIPEMGVQGYVNEDPNPVQIAGEEHIATYGPGVPYRSKSGGPKVPAGKA